MKTPYLDNEINTLKWLESANELTEIGALTLLEYQLIKVKLEQLKP